MGGIVFHLLRSGCTNPEQQLFSCMQRSPYRSPWKAREQSRNMCRLALAIPVCNQQVAGNLLFLTEFFKKALGSKRWYLPTAVDLFCSPYVGRRYLLEHYGHGPMDGQRMVVPHA